jgi:putative hydrolase of the HAD superfamily
MRLPVDAVCFDLDDTLCAYWDAVHIGLERAFELHGPAGVPVEKCIHAWARTFRVFAPSLRKEGWFGTYLKLGGPTRTEQMRLTLLELGHDDLERAASLSSSYLEERDKALKLFDDAAEVLQTLGGRYPLGLITNGPADIQRMEIETLGIAHFFQTILIEGELGQGKPHASVFRLAEKNLGSAAERSLMIGNSYAYDVLPAMEFGWHGIWIDRPGDVGPSDPAFPAVRETIPSGSRQPDAIFGDLRLLLDLL